MLATCELDLTSTWPEVSAQRETADKTSHFIYVRCNRYITSTTALYDLHPRPTSLFTTVSSVSLTLTLSIAIRTAVSILSQHAVPTNVAIK